MKPNQFSLRAATTDPVSTAKRADLPVLDEPQEAPQAASEAVQDDVASELVEAVPEPAPAAVEPVQAASRRSRRTKTPAPKTVRPATRQNARGVTVWVEPDVYRRLKIAGLDLGLTTQDLMMDAIEDYLTRHQRRAQSA